MTPLKQFYDEFRFSDKVSVLPGTSDFFGKLHLHP